MSDWTRKQVEHAEGEWSMTNPTGDLAPLLERSIQTLNPLTAADRCDRCGARAGVRLYRGPSTGRDAGYMEFCGHHFNKHSEALHGDGWAIIESRSE